MGYEYSISPATITARLKKVKITKKRFAEMAGLTDNQFLHYLYKGTTSADVMNKILKAFEHEEFKRAEQIADIVWDCQPPSSCFKCPYPDCKNNRPVTTKESEFAQTQLAVKDMGGGSPIKNCRCTLASYQ